MAVNILEHLWVLFIMIGGFISSRLISKIDALEKGKADAVITREEHLDNVKLIHELDRRVDENQHMSVGRNEHKLDVNSMVEKISVCHERINDLERRKADKIKNIRTHSSKEKNGES
jgi:hypothetical protein|tara:strand:+ start:42 stop:392 length:351 start_codon:yes stop_codon:yes gene_type:complete